MMISLYFSGTGNSKFVATYFSRVMESQCYSIEESVDFKALICTNDTIAFCYPIYGSCVPLIMREFVTQYQPFLHEKKIIVLVTQLLFSGDGARVFTDLLKGVPHTVVYAEHINMPNNICNLFILPISDQKTIKSYMNHAERKINTICENIKNGIIKKRGFNVISTYLGLLSQRLHFSYFEKKAMNDVKVSARCNQCRLCIHVCPMKNLKLVDGRIEQNGDCTLCYRCVNRCPQKAITVLLHTKVKKQYQGPPDD